MRKYILTEEQILFLANWYGIGYARKGGVFELSHEYDKKEDVKVHFDEYKPSKK